MKGLPYGLKDEGSFLQNSGVGMRKVPNDPAGENFYHKTIKDLFAIISNVMYIC